MTQLCRPDEWVPAGGVTLEPAAYDVVRSTTTTLVVAGPGAGKTELLAQRASYLLNTGCCASPFRILAISFKRDAAHNLADRVRERCGERVDRFDAMTLDGFAKGLVDRFAPAIPPEWRPAANYDVRLRPPSVPDMRRWLVGGLRALDLRPESLASSTDAKIKSGFERICHGWRVPGDDPIDLLGTRLLGIRWWKEQLARGSGQPSLSFPMLNRLAAFTLRTNPRILAVLRATYPFVFVDEFQDTTSPQYDLIGAAFGGSGSCITAVGDSQQRIMGWAGAMYDVFDAYTRDFAAQKKHLVQNHRSASELVRIQRVIATEMDSASPAVEAMRTDLVGTCKVQHFGNAADEAEKLADLIARGIQAEGKAPRDFCIVTREGTGRMVASLKTALQAREIRLRDESQLQDLLVEPVVMVLLAVCRLATRAREPAAWEVLVNAARAMFGVSVDEEGDDASERASGILTRAREHLEGGGNIRTMVAAVFADIGAHAFRSAYRQYANGPFLTDTVEKLSGVFDGELVDASRFQEAVDDIVGADAVPAMTIHKSKGLEFSTIIFLGLEDDQWWAFENQSEEEIRNFFVGISRASENVILTFSDVRDRSRNRGLGQQRKVRIAKLYEILSDAGVQTEDCR